MPQQPPPHPWYFGAQYMPGNPAAHWAQAAAMTSGGCTYSPPATATDSHSAASLPLQEATAAVVNASTSASPPSAVFATQESQSTHRSTKRPSLEQGADPTTTVRKRSKRPATDWTGTPETARIVGVGPTPGPTTTSETAAHDTPPTPSSDSAPTTQESGQPASRPTTSCPTTSASKHCEHGNSALDVWYFCRALETREEPEVLPKVEDEPVLTHKPKTPYVGCKLCKRWKTYMNTADGGVTSTIRAHLKRAHRDTYEAVCKVFAAKWNLARLDEPRTLQAERTTHSSSRTSASSGEKFTADGFLYYLARWIVADDQSINVVENEEFQDLIYYLCPDLDPRDFPLRAKVTTFILEQWSKTKKDIHNELKSSPTRVHYTCDIWSDQELAAYLAVTAHHICQDNSGKTISSCNHLVAFRRVHSHAGASVAEVIFQYLKDAGLLWKIGMITLDNASSNDSMMRALERLLDQVGVPFDSKGNRIRCFPHIVNIAVQHILEELKKTPRAPLEDPSNSLPLAQRARIADALAADPIGKVRALVSSCRQSDQRRTEFRRTIEEGNKDKLWKDAEGKPMELPVLQLLRDCETRWSSTFLMLKRVFLLYPAIQTFLQHASRADISHVALSADEYDVLKDIYQVLEIAHDAQQLVSSERTPSLSIALPAYELILEAWTKLRDELPHLKHYIDKGMSKIQEYVYKSRESRIYALAIVLNPAFKLMWIQDHWTPEAALQAEEWVLDAEFRIKERADSQQTSGGFPSTSDASRTLRTTGLQRLLSHAQRNSPLRATSSEPSISHHTRSMASCSTTNLPSCGLPPSTSEAPGPALRAQDRAAVRSEFDRYIAEGIMSNIESGADLLGYWALNRHVYPYMHQLALDILAVQASAVACERVFSSSKETDTLRRSRINPELMEALQCLKYHFKQSRLNLAHHLVAREEDYAIEGPVTYAAVKELISENKLQELEELLRNSSPTSHSA
ncbi:hypothetical protein BN946_scf184831.g9 [Trametes cinnabarina]|uniref:HAT C-terminal dimerisation domain-containing protein n=1 Tax=Pycnoporus cinnabarinus TaxID=5643 RepID=A0A060SVQ3_PYCCI|nr:hypothetical protein BN946_scf184831.g9 [Trametes cinnabarina]